MEKELVISGQGKVSVTPDVLDIYLTVTGEARSLKHAIDIQAMKVKALISFLRTSVAEKDITTTSYEFGAVTECDDKKKKQVMNGYQATQQFRVRASIENSSTLLEGVGKFAEVGGVSLGVRDTASAKEEAVNRAIANALERASRRAEKLGVRLGGIHYYEEGSSQGRRPRGGARKSSMSADSMGGAPEITPGETEISAEVTVVFGIE